MPLSSIVGHAHLIELLRTAVANERVPQSLLFAGPEGVGKRTTAIALAQAMNCPSRQAGKRASASERVGGPGATPQEKHDGCGKCPTCLRIARGQHTDVALIDKGDKASIGIDVLRARLLEVVGYRPFEARRRVYIIDGAEELTVQAQDALLKTLEEPPSSAHIILISAYADTLLPTIQSRCRRLRFGLLADQEVARVLMEIRDLKVPGSKVGGSIDAGRARLMASGAGGSVSRALAEEAGDLSDDRDAAVALLQAASAKPVLPRLKAAANFSQYEQREPRRAREKLAARLALVASLCRDLTAMHAGAVHVVANSDLEQTLRALTKAFPPERLSRAFDTVERAQQALERNAGPKIVADWVGATI